MTPAPPILDTSRRPSSAMPHLFVLVQSQPRLEVLATSNDKARLEAERELLLAQPWDQDGEGARELWIVAAIHLPARTRDRRRFQRQNRFR